jgi:hypothetical protein
VKAETLSRRPSMSSPRPKLNPVHALRIIGGALPARQV